MPNMPQLDPDTDNDLGKGKFSHDEESTLLAEGYVFVHAHTVPWQESPILFCANRPIEEVGTALVVDARRVIHHRIGQCIVARGVLESGALLDLVGSSDYHVLSSPIPVR